LTIERTFVKNNAMTHQKKEEKANRIKKVVAGLFARKGFNGASMRGIAKELGMTQSSLYHYFKNKEEILFILMNDAMDEALSTIEKILARNLSSKEKLKQVLKFYTEYYAGAPDNLFLLVNEMQSLNKEHFNTIREKQWQYINSIRSVLTALQRENAMKSIDLTASTFAFFGMVHYTIKWYHEDGPIEPRELANQFVEIFTGGILKQHDTR